VEHIEAEHLQRYLAGALELSEHGVLEDHLAHCSRCSDVLAELTAGDRCLSEAMALGEEEVNWIQGQDLTETVLRQIAPRSPVIPILLVASLVMLPGVWIVGVVAVAGANWLAARNTIGLVLDISRLGLPLLYRFIVWMAEGGLLTRLWPLFIPGAALWFWRLSHTKETNRYA